MRHPIGSKPLTEIVSKGDKVCIVCADVTRIWNHSDQYVIHIVNELNRGGIPDDDICILFAQAPTVNRLRKKTSLSSVKS